MGNAVRVIVFAIVMAGVWVSRAWGAEGAPAESAQPPIIEQETDPQVEAAERERRINARTERARREARFNQLDRDGDGYLSKSELRAEPALAGEPEVLDRDSDGLVSRTEFAALELTSEESEAESGEP